MNQPVSNLPWRSKTRVTAAGAKVRSGDESDDDLKIIEEWRAAHRAVLNTFQAILRNRTKNMNIIVAQRHKRRNTIFNKLRRLPSMDLARMDDVAGCRLIFASIDELNNFRNAFHSARFKHKIKNIPDKYNYIKSPKLTGYRGIHDVYSYDVNSNHGTNYKGLLVEIQYRTLVQHAWATAVEVIGFITESQPKFQQGDNRYERCMALASEILARGHEQSKGSYPDLSDSELLYEFHLLDEQLHLVRTLSTLSVVEDNTVQKKNSILIFHNNGITEVRSYEFAPEAIRELFKLEEEYPELDIVLVKADKNEDVRVAFRNYFSDAKDFVKLLQTAITYLSSE